MAAHKPDGPSVVRECARPHPHGPSRSSASLVDHRDGHLHCARLESRLTGGSVHAEPVRRPWHWSWPLRARLITTARRGAGPRAGGTSRHGLLTSGAGASCWPSLWGGEKAAREISRQERAGASRGGWGRARCMPRGCGRCPATRSRRRAHEDRTRTPRWPATAESPLSRRSRPVR